MKIKYSDLNIWLKVAYISAWVTGVLYVYAFLIGFGSAL